MGLGALEKRRHPQQRTKCLLASLDRPGSVAAAAARREPGSPTSPSPDASSGADVPEIRATISRASSSAARMFDEGGDWENPDSSTPHFSSSASQSFSNSSSHCRRSSTRRSKKSAGVSETAFWNISSVTVPGCCEAVRPLLRIGLRVQLVGHPVVRRGELADAGGRRDRNLGDRSQQQSLALVAVEPGQRRDAGKDPVVLVRRRVEMVPEPLDQLPGQTEPIPQARIAVLRRTNASISTAVNSRSLERSAIAWGANSRIGFQLAVSPPAASSSSNTRRRSASRASDRAARIRR